MAYYKKLGIFLKTPVAGTVKTRLVPPLSEDQAARLSLAFARDVMSRLERLKKTVGTIFYTGDHIELLQPFIPDRFTLVEQAGATLGERLHNAFGSLLTGERDCAVIIGTDSPDLPLQYIKRAFLKLKHKDVVLGPCTDGGYYLVGLKSPAPALFDGIPWGESAVLHATLERIARNNLELSLLPIWYDVDDFQGVSLLRTMMRARTLEKSGRLIETESAINEIFGSEET
jgi:rSAM/selenodomain-associated transferase 1